MGKPKNPIILLSAIGVLALLVSCKGDQQDVAHEAQQQKQGMRFTVKAAALPSLAPNTTELLASWPAFQDYQREIGDINGRSLIELRNKTERLLTYADSMARSVPDSLRVQPVVSRVVVLNSRVRLLDQQVRQDRIDSASVAGDLWELLEATANFYQQINQKLLKDAIDLQRRADEEAELEKQQRFLDSVYREEVEDKNKRDL